MSRRLPSAAFWVLLCCLLSLPALAAVHDVTSTCGGAAGAVGDGVADDTSEIQCHINAAATNGGIVYVPAGTYKISSILSVSGDEITIEGDGKGSVIRSDAANHVMISINGRKDIIVRDLYLLETSLASDGSTRSSSTNSGGIVVGGAADEILIENVRTRGFARGFQRGSTSDVSTNITMRDVWIEQANGWGIEIFDVEKFRMYNVRARNNGSEGIKIGASSRDWEIHGGRAWDNGSAGISVHNGGFRWLIVGTRLDGNAGAGLLVKASSTTVDANNPISEGTVVGVLAEGNQKGIDFFSGSASDPLPNHITVLGGVFKDNVYNGILLDGRNISLVGVVAKNNAQDGIYVRDRSFDVSIVDPQLSANGNGSGTWSGLRIHGDRVRVSGAQINAIDEPASAGDPTGTAMHKHSIIIDSAASDVVIESSVLRNAFSSEIGGTLTGATIRDTVGWVTQSGGSATVAAANTEVTVTHGLAMAPSAESISVTPVSAWGNVTSFWVESVGATTFKIKVTRGAGTATNVDFRWDADVSAP
jgi:hypothetical protein